ncbi:MAG: CD225/dispanin family protein [Actinomycetota bacterium]|uniref:CD225/dispanin family protein n=1 Tax=Mycobacterium lentiflavum TaxID=141349 RepID=A0ABY3UWR0_MYCLN|nr:CD225/dispanin family protein [Mycobacterium lentiflavum]MEE3065906.1 CD225/dispanin family protein [Actinomycetota bacterium]ULP42841.1 CD225/dispanin family protein [Mycobacterium lentiflavum]
MSYPPGPYEGSPEWQGQPQQPDWQGQPQQPGWQQPQQPGWPAQQPGAWPGQQEPDNYLVWAILCTVLCCLPFGIISLVYSNKVSGLWAQGRVAEAQEASSNAKKWAIIGAIAGGVTYAIIAILYIVIAVVAVSSIPSTTSTTFGGY